MRPTKGGSRPKLTHNPSEDNRQKQTTGGGATRPNLTDAQEVVWRLLGNGQWHGRASLARRAREERVKDIKHPLRGMVLRGLVEECAGNVRRVDLAQPAEDAAPVARLKGGPVLTVDEAPSEASPAPAAVDAETFRAKPERAAAEEAALLAKLPPGESRPWDQLGADPGVWRRLLFRGAVGTRWDGRVWLAYRGQPPRDAPDVLPAAPAGLATSAEDVLQPLDDEAVPAAVDVETFRAKPEAAPAGRTTYTLEVPGEVIDQLVEQGPGLASSAEDVLQPLDADGEPCDPGSGLGMARCAACGRSKYRTGKNLCRECERDQEMLAREPVPDGLAPAKRGGCFAWVKTEAGALLECGGPAGHGDEHTFRAKQAAPWLACRAPASIAAACPRHQGEDRGCAAARGECEHQHRNEPSAAAPVLTVEEAGAVEVPVGPRAVGPLVLDGGRLLLPTRGPPPIAGPNPATGWDEDEDKRCNDDGDDDACDAKGAKNAQMDPVVEAFARRLFNAYNAAGPNPWRTFDGRPVPKWDECGEQVRAKWTAAAQAAAGLKGWL